MISHAFRDLNALPIAGRMPEHVALRASMLSYVTGGTVFILSMIAFYFLGSLQLTTSEISTSIRAGASCKLISGISLVRNIGASFYTAMTGNSQFAGCSFPVSSTSPFCQCAVYSIPAVSIVYDSAYFSTHEDCISNVVYSCTTEFDTLNGAYFVACNFTSDGAISYTSRDPFAGTMMEYFTTTTTGMLSSMSGIAPCSKPVPTPAQLSVAVKSGLPPSYICAPFLQHPPYLCSVSSRLSPLQMVAQSSSLATNAIFVAGLVLVTILKWLHQQRQSTSSITPTLSSDDMPPQSDAANQLTLTQESRTGTGVGKDDTVQVAPGSSTSTPSTEETEQRNDDEKQAKLPICCVGGSVACCACIACGGV